MHLVMKQKLKELGLIKKIDSPVKLLGKGSISKSVQITAHMFSKSAVEKIEKVGGKVIYR